MFAKYMMRLSDFEPSLTFHNEVHGRHHGQSDMRLLAFLNNQSVGYIDYSEFNHQPAIKYIEVSENYRGNNRRGIGTALVKHLQSMYPDMEISWGVMTPEGQTLKNSLPTKTIYNPMYQSYLKKLKKIEELEKKYTEIIENKNTTQKKN